MPTFAALKAGYPKEQRDVLFKALGGEWPSKIPDEKNYGNTCAIRMSVALRKAGTVIPPGFREAMQGDGSPLVVTVEKMGKLLTAVLGPPAWGMSKKEGAPLEASDLPTFPGIIAYHVKWNNATGHVDLWTGKGFVGAGNFDDVGQGFDIAVWRVD